MGALIDTSVFIAIERGVLSLDRIEGRDEEVAISVVTASELLHGVERANTPNRRHQRSRFVEAVLALVPVVSADLEVARVHARVTAQLAMQGQTIGVHDGWIASTALVLGFSVATRNLREFSRVENLRVEQW